jgi:hypothetical protein
MLFKSCDENFGYVSGRYKPPSGARPPNKISEKESGSDWPRVEIYFIKPLFTKLF